MLRNISTIYLQVDDVPAKPATTEDHTGIQAPRGRWAERAEGQGLTVKQQDGKSVEFDFATGRESSVLECLKNDNVYKITNSHAESGFVILACTLARDFSLAMPLGTLTSESILLACYRTIVI